MATFEFVILAVVAVLFSAIIEQLVPKISSPLIQIGLGVMIALLAWSPINLYLDPEFFLLLFVAPLLFQDAKEADKAALWTNRYKIISLAVGLVIALMLSVGFATNLLMPSIPLAVAFALGAALGPTDAVAVLSLKKSVSLTRKENALLSGEALINDASGVVAFQFAISAATTGTWTVLNAGLNFLVLFFGGIILGLVLALVVWGLRSIIRKVGLESSTFFVLLELLAPFAIYIIAEHVEVSGILAVVAAGLLIGYFNEHTTGPAIARLNIMSKNVWEVLLYGLNGVVFVMLGIMLPGSMHTLTRTGADTTQLIILVFVITAILVVIRLAWFFGIMLLEKDKKTDKRIGLDLQRSLSALATTIAGPKGCVTLSIILSIPYHTLDQFTEIPGREEVIFLACGVIITTMLLANFILPILSPAKEDKLALEYENSVEIRVNILRNVITELNAHKTHDNAAATRAVIRTYKRRIDRIVAQVEEGKDDEAELKLSKEILEFQQNFLDSIMDDPHSEFDDAACLRYARNLVVREELLTGHKSLKWFLHSARRHLRRFIYGLYLAFQQSLPEFEGNPLENYRQIQLRTEHETVRYLERMYNDPNAAHEAETIAAAIGRHTRNRIALSDKGLSVAEATNLVDSMGVVYAKAYNLELEEIQSLYDEGIISRRLAVNLRQNVHMMQLDKSEALHA